MFRNIILSAALMFAAGFFNATMDKLTFHYSGSVFEEFNSNFWNPKKSWVNKWKLDENGKPIVGKERFLGSSTIFVKFTDAWHAAQSLMLLCFFLAAVFYKRWKLWFDLVLFYLAFSGAFNLFFHYVF